MLSLKENELFKEKIKLQLWSGYKFEFSQKKRRCTHDEVYNLGGS